MTPMLEMCRHSPEYAQVQMTRGQSAKSVPPKVLQRISEFRYVRCEVLVKSSLPIRKPFAIPVVSRQFHAAPSLALILDQGPTLAKIPSQLISRAAAANLHDSAPSTLAEQNDEDDETCIVCWEQPQDAVLLECGHGGLCVACADLLWRQTRRCPLCREEFAGVMRIVDASDATVRI